ncbi:transcription initiation factor TFIID subunit 8 [Selaginella moellendorffii]|uniref:transcription initiation factor TFIID subunit 8 n=1 Tax=Selaginella moellendorffii TaxID=88036 RepID=UPI000D1C5590|nr:transcription initiation factor TFIID subunit 8 [Selaginella moellendorffii]|eukprot:XP_024527513.1 transcription initiation factor TFIID subunit 8 [Selaginella moellendorffii]
MGGGSSGGSSSRDEFGRIVAKMAVAQICESVGFHSIQASAMETLADVAIRYLRDLARAAHFYSNLAARIESNAFDLIMAMEDVGPAPPAADPSRPIARSSALREVMRFVEYSEEIPFARPLPRFPVAKKRLAAPSFAQLGEAPPGSHIPSWLPALPDPHTYRHTPVWPDRKREPAANRLEQARQRRKAESSLVALHSRLSSTASMVFKDREKENSGSEENVSGSGSGNAFLAPPLAPGAKELMVVQFGGFKDGGGGENAGVVPQVPSIVEAFASVVESASNGNGDGGLEIQDGGGGNENGLALVEQSQPQPQPQQKKGELLESNRSQRVVLSFDFGGKAGSKGVFAKRILAASKQQQQQQQQLLKRQRSSVANAEDDKDERKKRAEQIITQGMDTMAAS